RPEQYPRENRKEAHGRGGESAELSNDACRGEISEKACDPETAKKQSDFAGPRTGKLCQKRSKIDEDDKLACCGEDGDEQHERNRPGAQNRSPATERNGRSLKPFWQANDQRGQA